jgi:hypothetical protein
MDTANPANYTIYSVPSTYGIALGYDSLGNTMVYCGGNSPFVIFNSSTGTYSYPDSYDYCLGVAVNAQGQIVTGSYYNGGIAKYAPDGTKLWDVAGQVNSEVRGIVVDSDDNIWAVHRDTSKLCKYNGTNGSPLGVYNAGLYPYTYSDATGLGYQGSILNTGTWTVIFDSEETDTPWGTVSWNSFEPTNTSVTVKVRSSNDQITWSSWEDVSNGIDFTTTPDGRYLQIKVTLAKTTGDISPILYDLTVEVVFDFIEVDIDIKPWSYPNSINPKSKGNVPVAILTTIDFDATTVDPTTVDFLGASAVQWALEDVDDDGDIDMILHFITQELNFSMLVDEGGDYPYAYLYGETIDSIAFQGKDTVRLLGKLQMIVYTIIEWIGQLFTRILQVLKVFA